jgi:hypothetical protein
MAEILRDLQAILLTAATTMHVWRDLAIAGLALVVIIALRLYLESTAS